MLYPKWRIAFGELIAVAAFFFNVVRQRLHVATRDHVTRPGVSTSET